ncbi:phage tail protein [Tumebacillus sp. DT12]|uniref:Phage tail protein n=1 Tax=Tumebacillus lacus TaxID=2995335 RepID=A0ABT3X471_9BACL|nr:major tail protein [Tumebacillus lacus]MCX7570411.1 phage tail protein [Tumebacillus lacus]
MAAPRTNLKNLTVALLTKDDITGATYGPTRKILDAVKASIDPKVSSDKAYGDGVVKYVSEEVTEIEVEFETLGLSLSDQAFLIGGTIENGVLIDGDKNQAPWVAFGFESEKANKKRRFYWLYKGKFSLFKEEFKQKEDKTEFQGDTIKGTFVLRIFDGNWRARGDEDEVGFTAAATWFDAVYEQPADAPAV